MQSYRSFIPLLFVLASVCAIPGCAEKSAGSAAHATAVPVAEGTNAPVMLAVYEAWFGKSDHINVGYSSHDVKVLNRQVDQAKEMGLYGFVVDWYGNKQPYID